MLVEVGMRPWRVVGDAKQKIEATLELAMNKMINTAHGILPRMSLALLLTSELVRMSITRLISSPFDNIRDEVNGITR